MRELSDEEGVWEHNAWDNHQWTPELEAQAESIIQKQQHAEKMPDLQWEEEGSKWDDFYGMHNRWFFKDRKWLATEFPELLQAESILEVGCGAGNTVLPLLRINNKAHIYACDFSKEAVELVRSHAQFDPSRCTLFHHDLASKEDVLDAGTKVDAVIAIFVLSAVHPDRLVHVIEKLRSVLKPGGSLFFRDYGRLDLTQLRFPSSRFLCSPDYYRRGDGTIVHYFTEAELQDRLFAHGWSIERMQTDRRLIVNRKRQLLMRRVWIQAKIDVLKE